MYLITIFTIVLLPFIGNLLGLRNPNIVQTSDALALVNELLLQQQSSTTQCSSSEVEDCADRKTVSGKSYTLVDSEGCVPSNCKSSCIYQEDGTTNRVCFSHGALDAEDEEFYEEPFRQGCGCKKPRYYCKGQCKGGKCEGRCIRPPEEIPNLEPSPINTITPYGPELQEFYKKPKTKLGCQNYTNMPTTDNGKFTCATVFDKPGGLYSVDSCNGSPTTYHDGDKMTVRDYIHYYPMGSILIRPGCSLYIYLEVNYKGQSWVATENIFNNKWGYKPNAANMPYGPKSLMCSCEQEPISCTPTDGWETVVYCDNKEGKGTARCTYSVSIGTTYSESATNSMKISDSVAMSIQEGLSEIFKADESETLTLGFDWSKTSTLSSEKTSKIDVTEDVDPGKILLIEQAVGRCGGNKISTNLFKFTEQDSSIGNYWKDTTTTTTTITTRTIDTTTV